MPARGASMVLSSVLFGGFFLALTVRPAHAYIDVGTAGFVLQALLAAAFGSLIAIKIFWRRLAGNITRFVSKMKGARYPSE